MTMTEWMLQSGLLAQREDFGQWVNILVIAIFVVVTVIGGLVKNAEAKKRQQQSGSRATPQRPSQDSPRETWQQRLIRRAEKVQQAIEAKYEDAMQARPQQAGTPDRTQRHGAPTAYEKDRPASGTRHEAARQRQARDAVASARRVEAKRTLTAQRGRPSGAAMPAARAEAPIYADSASHAPAETAGGLTPPMLDYSDPEALKKAILQLEILGKPLALREPFESA